MEDYRIALASIKEPLTSPTVFDVTPKNGAKGVPIDSTIAQISFIDR
jgi:hypothetical protein